MAAPRPKLQKQPARSSAGLDALLRLAAAESSFYSRRLSLSIKRSGHAHELSSRVPLTIREDLVAAKQQDGDVFSGRRIDSCWPLVTFQLDYAEETSLYVGLNAEDMTAYAEALKRCLLLIGVQPGSAVAIFDFGTSPAVYLASTCYLPYLQKGAVDALGCVVVCNDGVPNVSRRGVTILKHVRPDCVIVRSDCLHSFAAECAAEGIDPADYTRTIVVTSNEGSLDRAARQAYERRLGLPIYELWRSDLALFMAAECPDCRLLHTWNDLYLVETVAADSLQPLPVGEFGRLVVTSRFARCCPAIRVLTEIGGRLMPGSCTRAPEDLRLCA